MASLMVCVVFGLLLLCGCIILPLRQLARMEDLQAVIRAQQRCLNRAPTGFAMPHPQGGESLRRPMIIGWHEGRSATTPATTVIPLLRNYPYDPSVN
jgi:hypothetical protein